MIFFCMFNFSISLKSKRSLTEFRRLVNGERSNSRPVVHYLDSKYKPTVSSFKCNGNYINICRNGAKALVDNSQCSLRSSRKSCRINQMRADQLAPVKKGTAKPSARVLLMGAKVFSNLKFSGTVVLLSVSDISDFPKYGIKRSVCSIMNGQNGGSVLLGVNSQGIVQGFKIDRSQVTSGNTEIYLVFIIIVITNFCFIERCFLFGL